MYRRLRDKMNKALSVTLALALVWGVFTETAMAASAEPLRSNEISSNKAIKDGLPENSALRIIEKQAEQNKKSSSSLVNYSDNQIVTVIVELKNNASTLSNGMEALDQHSQRDKVKTQISRMIHPENNGSSLFGTNKSPSLKIRYDYYTVMNGFAVDVPYQYIEDIKKLKDVKNAFVENIYTLPKTMGSENTYKNDDVRALIGTIDSKYTGAGQVIAIVDSGLDTDHEAFAATDSVKEAPLNTSGTLHGNGRYINKKIPFVYDYADKDDVVKPDGAADLSHGTHVAGIAAANGGEKIRGAAPDAQVVALKVFDSLNGNGRDSDIIAAVEDAVVLGVDVINMSLGANAGFSTNTNKTYQDIYDSVKSHGILLSVAAGNAYSSTYGNDAKNSLPRVTEPDNSIIAAPASYEAALAVASSTASQTTGYLLAGDGTTKIRYKDATTTSMNLLASQAGEYELVNCGTGSAEAFGSVLQSSGLNNLEGKVALIERGGKTSSGENITFEAMADNAYAVKAKAILVYDNVESSSLTDMGGITKDIAAAFISRADGAMLLAQENKKIIVNKDYMISAPTEMSGFSSWGVTPDLKLKPEITAPGDGIYSSMPKGSYESMDGTSMAAPQVAGLSAVIKEYITKDAKFSSFSDTDKDQLISALLMNTAKPLKNGDSSWYSPRKQGAGLANASKAIDAKAYITVKNASLAKPKAELGDGIEAKNFSFTVHNLTGDSLNYTINTAALSEIIRDGYFKQTSKNYTGQGIAVEYTGVNDGKVTVPANGSTEVTVRLSFEDSFKAAVAEAVNGTFVDGFTMLAAQEGSGSDLSVPFLAFYGDWGSAPAFDGIDNSGHYSMLRSQVLSTTKDGQELGKNIINDALKISDDMGTMQDKYVISSSGAGQYLGGFLTMTGLLRNVDRLTYKITSQMDDNVMMENSYDQVPKTYYYSPLNTMTYAEAFLKSQPKFEGYDKDGHEIQEGWYTFGLTADIAGSDKNQSWNFDFYYDKTPPQLTSELVGEGENKQLVLNFSDAHYVSAIELISGNYAKRKVFNKPDNDAEKSADKSKPSKYTVRYNYNALVQEFEDNYADASSIHILVYDYALNYTQNKIVLKEILPKKITLSESNLTMKKGTEADIKPILEPADVNNTKITWSSSDEEVAKVDENGVVTALKQGNAVITAATAVSGVSASCNVTVEAIPSDIGLVLNRSSMTAVVGTSISMVATLADGLTGNIAWSSDNQDAVSVDENGKATIKKIGSAKITASVVSSGKTYSASCQITARVADVPGYTINSDGILTYYSGNDVNIVIPEGVTEIGDYAFNNVEIVNVIVPASVTKIGDGAFGDCYRMKKITFAENSKLKSIGQNAFKNTVMEEIKLPSSVTSIGKGAFSNSSRNSVLKSIDIPGGVTEIADDLFNGCQMLISVTLPDGITRIGASAFLAVPIKELKMPASLKEIDNRAFQGSSIASFTAPGALESIGNMAFDEAKLTRVQLNEGLKHIGEKAFSRIAVKSFAFPDSVTEVGSQVLAACSALETVTIGKGITDINAPFAFCENLKHIVVAGGNQTLSAANDLLLKTADGRIVLVACPSGLESIKMTGEFTVPANINEISEQAFAGNTKLNNLKFESGSILETIGAEAFYATGLEEVSMPSSMRRLSKNTFAENSKLAKVRLNKVESVGEQCFTDCIKLSELDFGSKLESIGVNAFQACISLKDVVLPDTLTNLGDGAFLNANGIKSIHIGAGIKEVGSTTFTGIAGLEKVTVSDSNPNLSAVDSVLMDKAQTKIIIYTPTKLEAEYNAPATITEIGDWAFRNAKGLKKATFKTGLKRIGTSAFNQCTALKEISLPDSVEKIGMFAFIGSSIEELTLGGKLNSMESEALSTMTELRHLVISDADNLKFPSMSNTEKLSTVYIGKGVKAIDGFSLFYTPSSAKVVFGPDITSIDSFAFNKNSLPEIYAPVNSDTIEALRTAEITTYKTYRPLSASLRVNQAIVTDKTALVFEATGGVGQKQYSFSAVSKDGKETELQAFSPSNKLTADIPAEGITIRAYVRDESCYTIKNDLTLAIGDKVQGSYVASASLSGSGADTLGFSGAVQLNITADGFKAGMAFGNQFEELSCNGSKVSADAKGVYWIELADNVYEIPLTVKSAAGSLNLTLKIEQDTIKSPAVKDILQEKISKAESLYAADYTAQTWKVLAETLAAAKAAEADLMAEQATVDNLVVQLSDALIALEISAREEVQYSAGCAMKNESDPSKDSMMSPILDKTATLEKLNDGSWLVTFAIKKATLMGQSIDAKNILEVRYSLDGQWTSAQEIHKGGDNETTNRFQIKMKSLSTPQLVEMEYYMYTPAAPSKAKVFFTIDENTLKPAELQQVKTPEILPAEREFETSMQATISCATSGASIYYTTDGTIPTTGSAIYTSPVEISKPCVIKAIAAMDGMDYSYVTSAKFTRKGSSAEQVGTPKISPNGGSFVDKVSVSITTDTKDAVIYYTTDGGNPTSQSTKYTGAINLTESSTLKAIAIKDGMVNSGVTTAVFTKTPSKNGEDPVVINTDGKYKVPVRLLKENENAASMGDGAFSNNRYAIVTVSNGSYTVEFAMNPITFGGSTGGLGALYGSENMQNVRTFSSSLPDGNGSYISKCSFTVDKMYPAFMITFTVSGVPSMTGTFKARLAFDWNSAVKTNENLNPNTNSATVGTVPTIVEEVITAIASGTDIAKETLKSAVTKGKGIIIENKKDNIFARFDAKALTAIAEAAGNVPVKIEAEKAALTKLNDKQRETVGDRPVFEFKITVAGKEISSLGAGMAELTVPYSIKEGEKPEGLHVWYLKGDGTVDKLECKYNSAEKSITFKTSHLSIYVVAYDKAEVVKNDDKAAEQETWQNPFSDVKQTDWFFEAVSFATKSKLFSGTTADTFSPKAEMSRAMLATVLYKLAGAPSVNGKNPFKDVPAGKYYTNAVLWANGLGIAVGYGNGKFGPDDKLTREQIVTILYNFAHKEGYDVSKTTELISYKDSKNISAYSRAAMKWAVASGLIKGTSSASLDPLATANRAQVAMMLKKFSENIIRQQTVK